ncbi:PAAR domain-containing protein [soil metagenome]
MSEKSVVCVGDDTSHGGKVVSGSASSTIAGRPIARLGDRVTCPKCKPHHFVIASASSNHRVDGSLVARDGDSASCGAVLIASRDALTT